MSIALLQFLSVVLFLSIIFLHLAKKNFGAAIAYGIQSSAVTLVLLASYWETGDILILVVALLTLIVKVILAPAFFITLIRRNDFKFLVSTYLNTPLTLITLSVFAALAHSQKLLPLTNIIPVHHALLSMGLSAIFISIFLIVNRKGAFSQVLGILSLENSIVAFAIFAGLEQAPMLSIGILFNLFIWLAIATVFISMLFRHFGTLDTSLMKKLKD
jgi:hydrogenase-4 component E